MVRVRRSLVLVALLALTVLGCADASTSNLGTLLNPQVFGKHELRSVDKIDLLLAIDNSRSMADKQQILALAIPDLVNRLVNPHCVYDGDIPSQTQPSSPTESCPLGTKREFEPVLDMHIGVISSSIGGHGADSCPNVDTASKECSPSPNTTNNDQGHLLARLDQCGGQEAPTYMDKKFLAWDPTNKYGGESIIENGTLGIVPTLRDMVVGVGQIGCGYESQLESTYRFLVDPNPYETIIVENSKATPSGTDLVLLNQRREFLRPDSMLAIVMLSDENDCSIKEYSQHYYVAQLRNGASSVRLPRARQECATNPNDPCCKSCGQGAGNCPDDPTCKDPNGGKGPALLSNIEDHENLRCWDQKRRFGIDFLYPTDRYVQAFSSALIADRDGNLVTNPIFSDLDPNDANTTIRDPSLVLFAGIVGVPWQDIALDKSDLKKGFKNARQLTAPSEPNNSNSPSTWRIILGDPENNVKPLDPLMQEAVQKRSGTNPVTGDMLADSTTPGANPINGHEWTIPNDDLQYACIFPLLPGTERDCTNTNLPSCDCTSKTNDNPLCQPDPNNMNSPTLQVKAKAYPGLRQLAVLRDLGDRGIVASVCPAQLSDPSEAATDFGYRPAIGGIVDRLKGTLNRSHECYAQTVAPNADGDVPCVVLEARHLENEVCLCDPAKARVEATNPGAVDLIEYVAKDPSLAGDWNCYCEVKQLAGDQRNACQNELNNPPTLNGEPVNGWCYIDATTDPPLGNVDIVKTCSVNDKRVLRFVGAGSPQVGTTFLIACSGAAGG